MIEVKFENPPGNEIHTRQFEPGQALRIGVHITGDIIPGLPIPWELVRFELYNGTDFFEENYTDLWGNAWVDWVLPNEVTTGIVKITAFTFGTASVETKEIPIGIGKQPPAIKGAVDWTPLWIIGGIAVGLAALYVFTRASGIHKVTSATASRIKGTGQTIQRKLSAAAKA